MITYDSAIATFRAFPDSTARGDAAAVMAMLADLGSVGHFLGNDLTDLGCPSEFTITPEELARAVKLMLGMSDHEMAFGLFMAGLQLPAWLPRSQAGRIIGRVANEGQAGNFPHTLAPMDFGQAVGTVIGNADAPDWLTMFIVAMCGGTPSR